MEILDIVDEDGNLTGETVPRNVAHAQGIRHRTAHVWIVRQDKGCWQVLLQKRSSTKDSFPGCYDTSSAGHVPSGFDPKESAIREMEEELGIRASEDELQFVETFLIDYATEFYGSPFIDREVCSVYTYTGNVDCSRLTLQPEEVEDVQWFDLETVQKGIDQDDEIFCVPPDGFAIIKRWCLANDIQLTEESLQDAEDIYRYMGCDPEITRYTGWNPYMSLEATIRKIKADIEDPSGSFSWIIRKNGAFAGTIGAYDYNPEDNSIEIGYSIARPYWGLGYASTALQKAVAFLLDKADIQSIHAWSHRDNLASRRVLQKAGFEEMEMDGDHVIYCLRKNTYRG